MPRRIFEIVFIALAVILVMLAGLVNCLQGTPFLLGTRCSYALTSSDLPVKVGATAIFLLFVALLVGPILATLFQPHRSRQSNHSS